MIQMQNHVEIAELLAFVRAVDAKSLSRAAAELAVPRATIGRRLARLEERLGTRLLRRTTRRLTLTDAGTAFYRQAHLVLDAVAQAQASVRSTDNVMRGQLRVSLPIIVDDKLRDILTSFASDHPEVVLTVDFSTRHIDLLRDGYDVALRGTADLSPGLVARVLRHEPVIAVASPAYLAAHGTPRSAKDLREHRCLTGFARGELPAAAWRVGRGEVHVKSVLSSNDPRLLRDAAVRGLGIALLPTIVLGDLIETGALVRVLPDAIASENRVAVVYPERKLLAPHVRAFVEALAQWTPTTPQASRPTKPKKRRR